MYSLVMMAAMTAAPDVPQDFLCHVNPSRYGGGYFSKHCFYDCCLPARYGWVNCWNKGFGYYPGGARSFCGSCATASYGHFYSPTCCGCGPSYGAGCGSGYGASCGSGGCGNGYGFGGGKASCFSIHGLNDWGIGCTPAYWTNVAGCRPCVTAPPYAYYTQRNPCCTYGHFAFDSGLIGHSSGVGYAGFGAYGNYGFYGAVPVQHPPTLADIPRYQPQDFMPYEPRPYAPQREYVAPGYVPSPLNSVPGAAMPEAPKAPAGPGIFPPPMSDRTDVPPIGTPGVTPMVPFNPPVAPGLNTPEIPKPPTNIPLIKPFDDKKEEPAPKKEGIKTLGVNPMAATVVLNVPAGAKVFVEGVQLKSDAAERIFRTPALAPGQEYSYTVKAVVIEDGREHEEAMQVLVIPGETTKASFEKLLARFGPTPAIAQTGGK
ncbi:TIGR03000 domain-containing protein [Zavarzinella formosa]|uniref:TIGR03000 domain-containing protein n=1 Tax=Zavarzinella formosa TaxID=360055 RepID=UPI0004961028|nr:TIGR03000 domain-containing protein [Zavarzinella formosa]